MAVGQVQLFWDACELGYYVTYCGAFWEVGFVWEIATRGVCNVELCRSERILQVVASCDSTAPLRAALLKISRLVNHRRSRVASCSWVVGRQSSIVIVVVVIGCYCVNVPPPCPPSRSLSSTGRRGGGGSSLYTCNGHEVR